MIVNASIYGRSTISERFASSKEAGLKDDEEKRGRCFFAPTHDVDVTPRQAEEGTALNTPAGARALVDASAL